MDNIVKDITGILMAIVGVAILYTLVNRNNQTPQVIAAGGNAFATMVSAAMGNSSGSASIMG